jgi:hypothetical protein
VAFEPADFGPPAAALPPTAAVAAAPELADAELTNAAQLRGRVAVVRVGSYPIVTFQYSSTTLYQFSYHIQYLFF